MEEQLRDASISSSYLDSANQLSIHIEWVDSLLLFSHLYNNYDSMATVQRHQVRLVVFFSRRISIQLAASSSLNMQLELDKAT